MKKANLKISPSILGSNFLNLKKEIKSIKNSDYIHLDIMDGHFVPNISFGPYIANLVANSTDLKLDIHLMLEKPIDYIGKFKFNNTEFITIHIEADNALETIKKIKSLGIKCGVSIKPKTSIDSIKDILNILDLVLVMSVEPGFGGQSFIESTYNKVEELYKIKKENNYSFLIEVDGGINLDNATKLKKAGADIVVVGSYLFKNKNRKKLIKDFKSII